MAEKGPLESSSVGGVPLLHQKQCRTAGKRAVADAPRSRSISRPRAAGGESARPTPAVASLGHLASTRAPGVERPLFDHAPCWLVSTVLHLAFLFVLSLLTLPAVTRQAMSLVVNPADSEPLDEIEGLDDESFEPIDFKPDQAPIELASLSPFDDAAGDATSGGLSQFVLDSAPAHSPWGDGDMLAGAFVGRGTDKARWLAEGGGTPESEHAVALALEWLAEHQLPDGGWNLDHTLCRACGGKCSRPGTLRRARNAATGLALLPFLGAGQTHRSGKYREQVHDGLYFLVNRMEVGPHGGSLLERDGTMYAHGICAIALCEAYGMTRDPALRDPAQQALDFIAYAQNPRGGGWRYRPRQRGDTSIVGWQLMALKSGHMAYLRVRPSTIEKAAEFLDAVSSDGGARYGYTGPGAGWRGPDSDQATTAIGLLCRMYLGWERDNPALERGAAWIAEQGPSEGNMYYDYYATQMMRHRGGDAWDTWNTAMRDYLVDVQARDGHERGSWCFSEEDLSTRRGGRLYCTSMATMILEVYYRHLPLYRTQSIEAAFPLD